MSALVEVKVAELIGPALDYYVARAEDVWTALCEGCLRLIGDGPYPIDQPPVWAPSTNWSQGGPLIEKHDCDLTCFGSGHDWEANCWDSAIPSPRLHLQEGPTPLIAVCRAIVVAKFGEVVRVPAELVPCPS